jgi:hypothetical protein
MKYRTISTTITVNAGAEPWLDYARDALDRPVELGELQIPGDRIVVTTQYAAQIRRWCTRSPAWNERAPPLRFEEIVEDLPIERHRFWASWCEPTDESGDYRPRRWPLANGIVGYWCTGTGDDHVTLCAVIDAANEDHVRDLVHAQGWSPMEWRFIEPRAADWMPPPDRFPR